LAELSGIAFFSLQLGEVPLPGVLPVIDLSREIGDFADSAAIIANLDLVITVDTACAHLVGGMGAQVWTMLPKGCDWRWLATRADSPWYPCMRLFRQESRGDWSDVMRRISFALCETNGKIKKL
jgi:ADP-heptose:LPS heptosyltransferase